MRVFWEETTGVFEEIPDFETSKIEKIEDQILAGTLLEILKFSLCTEEGFEYVALVKQSGWIEIRYLQNIKSSNPFIKGGKQKIGGDIGLFMACFWGTRFRADEVRQQIIDSLFSTWTELAEMAIKEISHMRLCFQLRS